MAVYETQRKTKITVPNWVIALAVVVVALILVTAVLLVKYYPALMLWLQ